MTCPQTGKAKVERAPGISSSIYAGDRQNPRLQVIDFYYHKREEIDTMKPLAVSCLWAGEENVEQILLRSFLLYLRRELEKNEYCLAAGGSDHV